MNQAQTITKNVVMVTVSASMFGGYKRTSESDIVAAGGKLPETDILTKGGKHIFPTEKLATFGTIKKNVFRDLWKFGVKSFGTGSVIAISEDDLDRAEAILDKAEADFHDALADLRKNYKKWLKKYIKDQPNKAAADIILKSSLKRDDACSRFSFSYDTFMPTPVGKNGSVESMASKLVGQLYAEVAQAATEAYDKTFCPRGSDGTRYPRTVGQKGKSKLIDCRNKMEKLSSWGPSVPGAVEIIDRVFKSTQQTGYIEDTPSNPCAKRLVGLVQLMMDAPKFEAEATKFVATTTPDEDIEVMCGIKSLWKPEDAVVQTIESIAANAEKGVPTITPVEEPATAPVAPEMMFF